MFRHIVLSKFKPEVTDEQRAGYRQAIEAFRHSCPTLRHLECGANVGSGPNHFDFAVVMDFDDRPGFREYMDGPVHKAYVETWAHPLIDRLAAIQHEF